MAYCFLKDTLNDRVLKDLKPPIQKPLPFNFAYDGIHFPNYNLLIDCFLKDGTINCEEAILIIQKAKTLLNAEENIVQVNGTVVIVGDIHGNFHDLVRIFNSGGKLDDNYYVFVGDYVDRGFYSCEVMLFLYALKICFPSKLILLRGNHECRERKGEWNFKVECLRKYSNQVYECFIKSFDYLPIACIINKSFLALHGGLSPKLHSLPDLLKLERRQEPTEAILDILWSDPINNETGYLFPSFTPNESRGRGYLYGLKATQNILDSWDFMESRGSTGSVGSTMSKESNESKGNGDFKDNQKPCIMESKQAKKSAESKGSVAEKKQEVAKSLQDIHDSIKSKVNTEPIPKLISIIRGHEPQQNGYKMYTWCGEGAFPPIITLFSCPDYCGSNNNGAVIKTAQLDHKFHVIHFKGSPKPFYLPNAIDLFKFSIPYMVKRCKEFVKALKIAEAQPLDQSKLFVRASIIRCKIIAIAMMCKLLTRVKRRKKGTVKKLETKVFVNKDLNLTIKFKVKLCKTF